MKQPGYHLCFQPVDANAMDKRGRVIKKRLAMADLTTGGHLMATSGDE